MTGFELLEALTAMPNEALELEIYCGIDGGDGEAVQDLTIAGDGSVNLYREKDLEEMEERDRAFDFPDESGDTEEVYVRNCERHWESERIDREFERRAV